MERVTQSVLNVVRAAHAHYVETDEIVACESPIERDMIVAFQGIDEVDVVVGMTMKKLIEAARSDDYLGAVLVAPQVPLGPYRADFLLARYLGCGFTKLLNVECDGHAFHRANPEQIARDMKRDRFFVGLGIDVMRFTGTRIYRDQYRCAREAVDRFRERSRRMMGDD